MWCCCPNESTEERTPLLRTSNDVITSPPTPSGPAQTARKFHPPESRPAAVSVSKGIAVITMKRVGIAEVDKKLGDHADLFNTQVKRWHALDEIMQRLKTMFPEVNNEQTILSVFEHIKSVLDDDPDAFGDVFVKRRYQHSMEITYDGKLVPYMALPAFTDFNDANHLVKEILDKDGPLLASIQLVVNDEASLRREVLVASLGGEGPDCLKACKNDVSELRRAVNLIETIRQEALACFEQLKAGVTPLTTSDQ